MAGDNRNIRRHIAMRGPDLGRGNDRARDRVGLAAQVDRAGLPRAPVQAPVLPDRAARVRGPPALDRLHGAVRVLGGPDALDEVQGEGQGLFGRRRFGSEVVGAGGERRFQVSWNFLLN